MATGLCADGFYYRNLGDEERAIASFRMAWEFERRAAMRLISEEIEPSRSILFRSAASLALLCGERDDARRLAHLGLAGCPTMRVKVALEAILDEADGLRWPVIPASEVPEDEEPPTVQRAKWYGFGGGQSSRAWLEREARARGFEVLDHFDLDVAVLAPADGSRQ